jgi:hypothetical protein
VPNRSHELMELEAMAAALLEVACKLPRGDQRHDAIKEIGRLRARIGRLREAEPSLLQTMVRQKLRPDLSGAG